MKIYELFLKFSDFFQNISWNFPGYLSKFLIFFKILLKIFQKNSRNFQIITWNFWEVRVFLKNFPKNTNRKCSTYFLKSSEILWNSFWNSPQYFSKFSEINFFLNYLILKIFQNNFPSFPKWFSKTCKLPLKILWFFPKYFLKFWGNYRKFPKLFSIFFEILLEIFQNITQNFSKKYSISFEILFWKYESREYRIRYVALQCTCHVTYDTRRCDIVIRNIMLCWYMRSHLSMRVLIQYDIIAYRISDVARSMLHWCKTPIMRKLVSVSTWCSIWL